jgi:mRNA interferase RelE/StbE
VAGYRLDIRSRAAEVIRHLPPEVKRAVKAAIRSLVEDPMAGEPLHGELEGRRKFRVRRYRVIYRIDKAEKIIRVIAVGHRRSIYEEFARQSREDE